MSKSFLSSLSVAALAGGAVLVLELSSSAFTLYETSAQPVTSRQFDKVYFSGGYRGGYAYRGGYGYRYGYHGGYGYHPYGWGGAAAVDVAALGAAAVSQVARPRPDAN